MTLLKMISYHAIGSGKYALDAKVRFMRMRMRMTLFRKYRCFDLKGLYLPFFRGIVRTEYTTSTPVKHKWMFIWYCKKFRFKDWKRLLQANLFGVRDDRFRALDKT